MSLRVDELEGQIKRLASIFPSELPKGAKPVKRPAAPANPETAAEDFDLFGSDDVSCFFGNLVIDNFTFQLH